MSESEFYEFNTYLYSLLANRIASMPHQIVANLQNTEFEGNGLEAW